MSNNKWLIITEKPSVANDLAKAIGGFKKETDYYISENYLITWAIGHLLELLPPEEIDPKYKRWLLQDLPILPEHFEYKPKKGQSERISTIKQLSKKQDVVGLINACDAGREGELIFREIYDFCNQKKPFKRLWLQSMTQNSIKNEFGMLKPGEDYDNLGDAARCRSESDWLIGMNGTRAITKRLKTRNTKGVWSVGRVQTPTLALIVKRELEFLKHRPEPYFNLEGRFSTATHEYSGLWFDPGFKKQNIDDDDAIGIREREDRIFSKTKLESILENFNANRSKSYAKETRKESKEIAPQLFDLTLLQREANRKFGLSASRTLQAAQRLYEKHKLLTYPRTDSRYLPNDYVENVNNVLLEFSAIPSEYSKIAKKIKMNGLLNKERIFNDKYVSDHFAIIPTGQYPSEKLDGDDLKIFDLVLKRFFSAFMSHAIWAKVERITTVGDQNFRTRVQDLQVPGWREVYGLDTEEESKLPQLPEGLNGKSNVTVENIESIQNATKPPPRLSEAKLLSLMEHCGKSVFDEEIADALKEKGIGTPATRADIIENLIIKEYVVRSGKALKATAKSIRLMDVLTRIPVDALAKVELTGEMEHDLKLMEKGLKKRSDFMKNMFNFTQNIVEKAKTFEYESIYKNEPSLGICPACKKGKISEGFWGYKCSNSAQKKEDAENHCQYIIWKEKNLRYIDRSLVQEVLEKNIAGPFEFSNASGTTILEEFLTISLEKGIVFCTESGEIKETSSAANAIILYEENVENTFLNKPGILKETEVAYLCEFGEQLLETQNLASEPVKKTRKKAEPKEGAKKKVVKPKKIKKVISRMPKVLCGRSMSFEEYKSFIVTGSTAPILDFKSKKGRPFGAILNLKENGNFEFKFVSRKNLLAEQNGETIVEKKPRVKKAKTKANVVKKS